MGLCNVAITDATLTPNPVQTSKQYIISVTIDDVLFVIGEDTYAVTDFDNITAIQAPDTDIILLADGDGAAIVDIDGSGIEQIGG